MGGAAHPFQLPITGTRTLPWVGELRNMWKPTAQPGLWFHGGNLMQSRHYSLYLGLQLKAGMEGISKAAYD